jgi:hypothetical protein
LFIYLFYAWPLHFSACCEVYVEIKAKTRVILRRRRRKAYTGDVTVFVDCKLSNASLQNARKACCRA